MNRVFYSDWTSPVFNFLKRMGEYLIDLLRFSPHTPDSSHRHYIKSTGIYSVPYFLGLLGRMVHGH
jgi:hypothetical protein